MWPVAITTGLEIWFDHQWPRSLAYWLAFYSNMLLVLVWFGYQVWTGYRRRRPHWTRESWVRYLRLAAMPVLALVLLFTELYFFDSSSRSAVFGAPQSVTRSVWILIDLALMAAGAVGVMMAISWLDSGEPSAQFTRTRWFRGRRTT